MPSRSTAINVLRALYSELADLARVLAQLPAVSLMTFEQELADAHGQSAALPQPAATIPTEQSVRLSGACTTKGLTAHHEQQWRVM